MRGHFNLVLHFIAQNREKHPLVFWKTKKDATVKKHEHMRFSFLKLVLSVSNILNLKYWSTKTMLLKKNNMRIVVKKYIFPDVSACVALYTASSNFLKLNRFLASFPAILIVDSFCSIRRRNLFPQCSISLGDWIMRSCIRKV